MNDILDIPRHPLPEATAAAGVDQNVFRSWLNRKIFLLGRADRGGTGRGRPILLSTRTVYGMAITAQLARQGVPPGRAFNMSRAFTSTLFHYEHGESREPGRLFPTGLTILLGYPDEDSTRTEASAYEISSGSHRVVRLAPDTNAVEFFDERPGVVIANCNIIVRQVNQALGLNGEAA